MTSFVDAPKGSDPPSAYRCLIAFNSIKNRIENEQREAQVVPSSEAAYKRLRFMEVFPFLLAQDLA